MRAVRLLRNVGGPWWTQDHGDVLAGNLSADYADDGIAWYEYIQ